MATIEDDEQDIQEIKPFAAQALTDWENEPSVRQLADDLAASKPAHDWRSTKVQEWNDARKVRGKFKPKHSKGRSGIQPKLIRRQAEWRYSALTEPFLGSDKLFDVKPVTFEDVKSAEQNDLVLNNQWRSKLNRVKFIDEYVRTAVDEGSVIVRVGWFRQTKTIQVEAPVWTYMVPQSEDQVTMVQTAQEYKHDNPRGYEEEVPEDIRKSVDYFEETGTMAIAVQAGTQMVPQEKIIDNRPTVTILHPDNFYIDPSCEGDIKKANFAVVSFETSQAELKKEPNRYKNLEFVDWENATPLVNPDHATKTPNDFNFQDALRKRVVAYEYWGFGDIHGTGELVAFVATWIGNTMVRCELNPYPDQQLPFIIENYMPEKRDVFGEPDAEILQDNQAVLGALMRGMIDLMGRSANSQIGFAKGMLDAVNRRKFDAGMDYEYNPAQNPLNQLIEHKYPEIPQSAMLMLTMQNQDAEALSGVKAFAGGISGEAYGDVAAGIRGVLDASSKREMSILRRLANGVKCIGEKIVSMNAEFLSEKETVRITNDEFIEVARNDLYGSSGCYDLIVDISTAEIDNKKAQDLAFMLQTMGNTVDFSIVQMILVQIAKLQRMPDLARALEKYEPKPDPIIDQLKQLEVQEKQANIEKLRSETALNEAKRIKEMEVADNLNLNTLEQETGTKHARDMENQRGQAEGNQDLEVTKSLLQSRKLANGQETKPDVEAAVGWNQISKNKPGNNDRPANSDLSRNGVDPVINPGVNI